MCMSRSDYHSISGSLSGLFYPCAQQIWILSKPKFRFCSDLENLKPQCVWESPGTLVKLQTDSAGLRSYISNRWWWCWSINHTSTCKDMINSHLLRELNLPHLSNNVVNSGDQSCAISSGLPQFLHWNPRVPGNQESWIRSRPDNSETWKVICMN